MPRFDLYRNPNPRATHELFLDVQSDLVRTATRWCVPLLLAPEGMPALSRAQHRLSVGSQAWLLDTPNILAVPAVLLRVHAGRLEGDDQLLVEAAIEFMLRGY